MQRKIEVRGRIILIEDLRDSKIIIDFKGTILISDVSHVMRKATLQNTVLETKDPQGQTRRRGIMLILLKTMKQQAKEQGNTLQVMKNMF